MSDLKTVLVTGGTSGLGQAIARGFAAAGHSVIAAGLGDLPADEPQLRYQALDVTDGAAINALVSNLPALNVVVNAAGVIRREEELGPDVFAQVVDINLNGTMRVCAAARPLLAQTNGVNQTGFIGDDLVPILRLE